MKKLILLLSCILFMQCSISTASKKNDDVECDSISLKISHLINDYYMIDNEQSFIRLDSALAIIDSIEGKCEKYNGVNSLRRLAILSIKHEYTNALEYAELLNGSLIGEVHKSIIVNRFKAMVAMEEGDVDAKDQYIKDIINLLQLQFSENEISSILQSCDIDSIMKNPKYFYLIQLYYYRAELEGIDKITNELSLIVENCEEDVLWILTPDSTENFMIFIGI